MVWERILPISTEIACVEVMASRTKQMEWLGQLKATQLHQLAVALGSPCSGSKATVTAGICATLASASLSKPQISNQPGTNYTDLNSRLSIVSIDMGIQNLAYAHILVPRAKSNISEGNQDKNIGKLPLLCAWERLSAFSVESQDVSARKQANPAAYMPSSYASATYRFITDILQKYDPTHILIEQQRFRSGGGSAVAEWTIRVGIFEAMLHATLRTLQEERKDKLNLHTVTSVNPARTARFWLEGNRILDNPLGPKKITGREGKQAKIDTVGHSFLRPEDNLVQVDTAQAKAMQAAFLERWLATSKGAKRFKPPKRVSSAEKSQVIMGPKLSKLDDLADCLLQAIAWLEWQHTRELVLEDLNAQDPTATVQQRLLSLDCKST